MIFDKIYLLPLIFIIIFIFLLKVRKRENEFFSWVEDHWFFIRTKRSQLSSWFYFIGVVLLLLSLLDLKGKPEKIKAKIPDQRTIIMLDTSTSMLAEDVRPNRFLKSLFLARHFVKNAIGHQISIIVFSDTIKKLVPFTTDYDLLDSRIEGLKSLDINKGGTSLKMAILETLQYLRSKDEGYSGNLLIFTDAEETEEGMDKEIPEGVSVAAVGIGTAKGGPIPIRDVRGIFRGNKQFEGNDINTKLDEVFLRQLGEKIKNYKYWIATSYTLPTEEVLNFFTSVHKKNFSEGEVTLQEIYLEYLLIPSLIFLSLGFLLRTGRTFRYLCFLYLFLNCLSTGLTWANTEQQNPYEGEINKIKALMKQGKATKEEKLKLAELFLKSNDAKNSSQVYKETLKKEIAPSNVGSYLNYGTSLLGEKKYDEALDIYNKLSNELKNETSPQAEQMKEIIRKNTLFAFQQKKQKQNDQSKEGEDGEPKPGKDEDQNKKNKSGKGDSKDKKKQDKTENENDDKNNRENDKRDDENNKGEESNKEEKQEQKELKNKADKPIERVGKKKLPSLLKQLINDDRKLQEKLIDASTNERKKLGPKKDW